MLFRSVGRWIDIMKQAHTLTAFENDQASILSVFRYVDAAEEDPQTYDRAKALFLAAYKEPVDTTVTGCRLATADPFIAANYVAGDGSAETYSANLNKQFDNFIDAVRYANSIDWEKTKQRWHSGRKGVVMRSK